MELNPIDATAREIAQGVNEGRWTAEAVTRAFLERCGALDDQILAWAALDPDLAIQQARAVDRDGRGKPLAGVPFGVKDIFATADYATEYGSPIYRGNRPGSDAACVALARAAGAVILGKTTSTEFAANKPTATRNPRDLSRSPGGSSSGSAAAVAASMVPLANGTQTAGSVIRPAAYCGIVGYKPSFGSTPLAGLKPSSESLDTVGFFARSVGDAALFAALSAGRAPFERAGEPATPPRFALCRSAEWSAAESGTIERLEAFCDLLRGAGADVPGIALPFGFEGLAEAQWSIMAYETTRSLAWERLTHPDRCSASLRAIFDLGESLPQDDYADACVLGKHCRALLDDMLDRAGIDVLLAPAAPGEAPKGLESTGDPILNRVWTLLHMPCLTLPVLTGPADLPLGVQLIGRIGRDRHLIDAAAWIEARFPYRGVLDDRIA